MKFSIRLLICMICLLLLVPFTIYTVGAAELTEEDPWTALLDAKDDLDTIKTEYRNSERLNDTGRTELLNEINVYYTKLVEMENNPTLDAVQLRRAQGFAAGTLAYIYYTHPEQIEATADVYLAQKTVIAEKTTADTLSFFESATPDVHDCYTAMLSAIYREKLTAIKQDGDSTKVTQMIEAAVNDVINPESPDYIQYETQEGANYQAHYENTCDLVQKQRYRDAASAQLQAVFGILYPDTPEDFTNPTNPHLVIFYGKYDSKSTVSELNTLLRTAVLGLLEDRKTDNLHTDAYVEDRKTAVTEVTAAATEEGVIADLSPIFENYTLDRYRAEQKDELLAYEETLNPSYTEAEKELLHSVIDEYIDKNGILDGCSDKAAIDAEVERAKLRADWVDTYLQALADMQKHDADLSELLNDAEGVYLRIDHAVTAAKATDTEAQQKAIEQGQADLADLIAEAETLAYKKKHANILNKNVSDVTASDKESLEAAIADSALLSPAAAEKLQETLSNNVGQKYKKILREDLQDDVKDDVCAEERVEYADVLCTMADQLSTNDLTALQKDADALLAKSEQIAALFDYYSEILSDPNYKNYSSEHQNSIHGAIRNAADTILYDTKDTSSENLNGITEKAILEMTRWHAIAEVSYATDGSEREDVDAIESEAVKAINQASMEQIPAIKNDAIVDIKQLLLEDDLSAQAEALKQAIANIECLTDADVADAQARIDGALDSAKIALKNADSLDELEAAKALFESGTNTVLKNAAAKAIQNKADALQDTIDSHDFVDPAAKQAMRAATDAEKEDALAKIQAATDTNTVLSCMADGLAKLDTLEGRMNEGERLKAAYDALMQKKDSYSELNLDELNTIYTDTLTTLYGDPQNDGSDPSAMRAAVDNGIAQMRAVSLDRIDTADKLIASGSISAPDGYDPKQNGYAGAIESVDGIPSDAILTVLPAENGETDIEKLIRQAAKDNRVYQSDGTPISRELRNLLKACQLTASLDITLGDVTLASNRSYAVSILLSEEIDTENILGVVYIREDGAVEFYEIETEEDLLRFTTSHFSNYYVVSERVMNLLPLIIVLAVILLCEFIALIVLYVRRARKKKSAQALASVLVPTTLLTKFRPTGGLVAVCLLGAAVLGLGCWIAYLVISELRDDHESEEEYPDELPEEEEKEFFAPSEPEAQPEATPQTAEESTLPVAVGVTALTQTGDAVSEEEEAETAEEIAVLAAPEGTPALDAPEELAALEAPEETPALNAPEEVPELEGRDTFPALDAPTEPIEEEPTIQPEEDTPLYEATFDESVELLHEVSVDEVDALMTDEEAEEQQQIDESDTEVYSGAKRAQINLDVISQHFAYGDTVTLNSLKEKKLVPKNVGFVKILARGTLDKALTILAQDFSTAALKMILLTGGTPILTHSSPERGGKIKKK